jgi:putative addiction module component (TIGR02574 family)
MCMSRSVPQVFDDALALGEDDRAKLVARLVESLDGELDVDAGDLWAAEIERRLAKIDAGQARLLSMDEAVARLHRAARGQ